MGYKKLVRDKVPEIAEQKGMILETYICDDQEYAKRLKAKLQEEVDEFLESDSLQELADILEIVYALAKYKKITEEALDSIREKKLQTHGAFKKKIVLIKAAK